MRHLSREVTSAVIGKNHSKQRETTKSFQAHSLRRFLQSLNVAASISHLSVAHAVVPSTYRALSPCLQLLLKVSKCEVMLDSLRYFLTIRMDFGGRSRLSGPFTSSENDPGSESSVVTDE